MGPRILSALADAPLCRPCGPPGCMRHPYPPRCSPFRRAAPPPEPPSTDLSLPFLPFSPLSLGLHHTLLRRVPRSIAVHAVVHEYRSSSSIRAAPARPSISAAGVPSRSHLLHGTPRSPPLGLLWSLTPQGDGTGLSGCPQGLVPEWPVIQSLAPNARQLSPIGHPRVHVSPIYCIPNVLLANHTRSPFHRPTPRSTFASRSIKRSPSRRAS